MNNILMGLFISRLDMAEKSSELEGITEALKTEHQGEKFCRGKKSRGEIIRILKNCGKIMKAIAYA